MFVNQIFVSFVKYLCALSGKMEGRYLDYRFSIYQTFDEPQAKSVLNSSEKMFQWLLNELP